MVVQWADDVRAAAAAAIPDTIGAAPVVQIRTGSKPANCAAARTGTLLVEVDCPATWLVPGAAGVLVIDGLWEALGIAAGTAGYFSIMVGSACKGQGSISASGGGGDMIVDDVVVAVDETFRVTQFTVTLGGA